VGSNQYFPILKVKQAHYVGLAPMILIITIKLVSKWSKPVGLGDGTSDTLSAPSLMSHERGPIFTATTGYPQRLEIWKENLRWK